MNLQTDKPELSTAEEVNVKNMEVSYEQTAFLPL